MTIQATPSAGTQLRVNRPLPNLLVQGFQLGLRNWPCVVWAYAANLFFSLLASVPFAAGLASYLDHSLAAQRIAGTVDFSVLGELALHLRDTGFIPMAMHTAGWLNMLQVVVLFVLFAGSVFVFVSAEPPRLSVLLRGGVAYFWRFARAAILAGLTAVIVLGILLAVRAAVLARASAVYVERRMFVYSAVSGAVVLLVAMLVRLWWDLVEVYIVRNAMDGERSVRQALLPALRLLGRYFFRIVGSFLLTGLAGLTALVLCLLLWKVLPAHQVWLAALLAQAGLFFLLAGRFWQRGVETALVMSADPPRVAQEELATEEIAPVEEEDTPVAANVEYLSGLSEPTLRDLVLKLRTEPLANPEAAGPLLRPTAAPEPEPAKPVEVNEASTSLLDRHVTKFPLGGITPDQEADPADPVEKPELPAEPEKTPHAEKKPLP
jgi:hypothetical protein